MDEQKVRMFFNIGEKPVKLLLNSYFELFQKHHILDFCEAQGISSRKVPNEYKNLADMISIKNEIGDKLLQHDSILKIPLKSGDMNIENVNNHEMWTLQLECVPSTQEWNEEIFTSFGEQSKMIKQHIGNMFMMCRFVFDCLKSKNRELETIKLDIESSNVTLKLLDSRFPTYEHNIRIGHSLTKKIEE